MIKKLIVGAALCAAIFVTAAVSAAPSGVDAWNEIAAQYNFDSYPAPAGATFEDMYNGSNFAADLDAIGEALGRILSSPPINLPPDDTFNATLENL